MDWPLVIPHVDLTNKILLIGTKVIREEKDFDDDETYR